MRIYSACARRTTGSVCPRRYLARTAL